MKIRITKGRGWYEDKVGEVFEVVRRSKTTPAYYVIHDGKYDDFFVRDGYYEIVDEEKSAGDAVNSPSHYNAGEIEVIDIIAQTVAGYDDPFVAHCVGTATKYLNRAPYKHASPLEDLKKSRQYLTFAIEHLERLAKGDE